LERETTDEEFTAMYVDFEVFDDLEELYFDMEETTTALIAAYVDDHIADFARDNFVIPGKGSTAL